MYEMYVVNMMQEQTIELSDERIGIKYVVGANGNYARISLGKLGDKFNKNDEVIVLTISEHQKLLQQIKNADNYLIKMNQLENEINDADIRTLKKDNEDLQKQIKNKNNSINTFKTNSVKNKAKIEDLQKTIKEQEQTIAELKQMNDNIAKQLDNSIDASEIEDLQNEIQALKEQHETSQKQMEYWKQSYENLLESSDEVVAQNESLIGDNEKLRNDNNAINETNKLLNENIIALKTSFDETKQQLQSDFEKQEKELKETIKNNQSHIGELTDKYQSLLPSKEYIPQKQHFDEILALKDEIRTLEKDIETKDAEIEKKLATQKSDLLIEHNNQKAQLLVGYNQELDKLKLKYNNLANDYNYLLNGVDSLTRFNTLFNGKHNEIKKDKEQVEILEIKTQLPPSDENVLEFVPKEQS